MPICEVDPWRFQYFDHAQTAANIPTEDSDAWLWNPAHRWVYDKLAVALSQGLDAGPHGIAPPRFPVFSKPIINLKGMGVGSRVLRTAADYERHYAPGHMWMTLLEGRHVSSDVAVVDGEPRWWRHVTGKPAGEGTFDHWTVHAAPDADIEARCGAWIAKNLAGYTGMLNLETIGGTIIEAHLRFPTNGPISTAPAGSMRWSALSGRDWDFVRSTIAAKVTASCCSARTDRRYRHPPRALVEDPAHAGRVERADHVPRRPRSEWHAMPPGGFRLAIVNCLHLEIGRAARESCGRSF